MINFRRRCRDSSKYIELIENVRVGSAIGASMMLYPAISTVSTWFSKRRALALGLTSTVSRMNYARVDDCADRLPPGWLIGWHSFSYNVPKSGAYGWLRMDYESMCNAHLRPRGRISLLWFWRHKTLWLLPLKHIY